MGTRKGESPMRLMPLVDQLPRTFPWRTGAKSVHGLLLRVLQAEGARKGAQIMSTKDLQKKLTESGGQRNALVKRYERYVIDE